MPGRKHGSIYSSKFQIRYSEAVVGATHVDAVVIPAGNELTNSVKRTPRGESYVAFERKGPPRFHESTYLKTGTGEVANWGNISHTRTISPTNTSGNVSFLLDCIAGDLQRGI